MLAILVLALGLLASPVELAGAAPMGTAFTYQSRLIDANKPADGLYDLRFRLYDANVAGTQKGSTITVNELDVVDGSFIVYLDFGSDVFDGDACWLEIGVRPNGGGSFTTLSPRQEITPTPYALQTRGIFVDNAGDVGIGTASPTAKLDVNGTIKTAAIYETLIWLSVEFNSNWMSVAMSADGTKQTAVVYDGQIYVSTDSGNTWTDKESNRQWYSVAMSADGTKQTAVVNSGQIYVSTDSGNTWTAKESDRQWRSVAMSADGKKQTAVVYNGKIYVSTDSGNTWTDKESIRHWWAVAMSADGKKQTAVVPGVPGGQIYVSTDSGNTWTAKESNRNWWSVAMSADGTKQTAVVNSGQIYVSTDSGNNWKAKESNRDWYSIAMSADGTKQTAVVPGGKIYVSTDSGNTWTAKESSRLWWSVAMSADGTKQTAVVYGGQIYIYGSCIGVGIGTTSPVGKLDVNGSIYQRGFVLHADYVFEPGYKLESIDEHSEFMWQKKHLPAMPKIQKDENGQEIVEIGARSRGVVEELEKAHIYIEQLNKENKELRAKLTTLDVRLNAMESLVAKLSLQQEGGIK